MYINMYNVASEYNQYHSPCWSVLIFSVKYRPEMFLYVQQNVAI